MKKWEGYVTKILLRADLKVAFVCLWLKLTKPYFVPKKLIVYTDKFSSKINETSISAIGWQTSQTEWL